jgi:hypothetical protein
VSARGQANLIGFAAAVLIVTTVTVAGVALADDALVDADRDPATTHAAETLAAYLVDGDAPHARRQNVLRASALPGLNASALDDAVPPIRDRSLRVTLGDRVLVERDGPDGALGHAADGDARSVRAERAVRVERLVSVERTSTRRATVDLSERRTVAVDDHVGRIAVTVRADDAAVTAVRAGDRVVLSDPSGLDGQYAFVSPRTRPLSVEFESDADRASIPSRPVPDPGEATVTWRATNASVERLAVVVGD